MDDGSLLDLLPIFLPILFTFGLLALGFFAGTAIEKKHFRDIQRREVELRQLLAVSFRKLPTGWQAADSRLVTGSVVVSLDYFKRFLAGLRAIFGGRVKSYEPLLDRGRREAMLRMKESARDAGCNAVLNVRLQTSTLASGRRDGKGVAGIEILVFGTAIRTGNS